MAQALLLKDYSVLADVRNYVSRLHQMNPEAAVRLVAHGSTLAMYSAPLYVVDSQLPDMLALRVFPLREDAAADKLVPAAELLDRIMRRNNAEYALKIPPQDRAEQWAGISPPQQGWTFEADIEPQVFQELSVEGINNIAQTIPDHAGAPLIHKAREQIWGATSIVQNVEVPHGVAFILVSLGFLAEHQHVRLFSNGSYLRFSTDFGHVLVKKRTTLL